ncbi:MAG: ABC transporter substrate-binding protein [Bacillus sp. (in: Bacteria)]|nr:ABC transporter substrate-binding protein [Bacillus sp. (in: firmicutes)]
MKKKLFAVTMAVLLILTSIPIISAETTVDQLKIGISRDEYTINPYTYNTGYPGLDMMQLVYDTMFHLDENLVPQPWLVKEYEVSEDGLTYDFIIHENVKWHDGELLTAEDIKFTVDYFMEYPKSRFTDPLRVVEHIEVHDDTSLTFVLSQPAPNFILGPLSDVPIIPKHHWRDITNPDEESDQSIGSGPYIFVEHRSDRFVSVRANHDYFKGKPAIEEIIFPIIPDTTALYTALRSGELDVIAPSLTPELVEQFESNPNLNVVTGPGFGSTLFHINASEYPMSEPAFRQAIKYAIDPQYLVDIVLLGYGEVASPGWIHPASQFYNDAVPGYSMDVDKAKQLLDDAGFVDLTGDGYLEDQNGERIDLDVLVASNNPVRLRTAEIITEWLNDIGIRARVQAMDSETSVEMMWPGFDVTQGRNFDLGMFGWSAPVQLTPDRMIDLFYSDLEIGSLNLGAYSNTEFDKLADQLNDAIDPDERMEIIYEMQQLVAADVPIITLFFQEVINAYNPNVYDGYVFQAGKGIINKLSFINLGENQAVAKEEDKAEAEATEEDNTEVSDQEAAAPATSGDQSNTNNALFVLLGIVVGIVVVGFYIKKKSKNKNEAA